MAGKKVREKVPLKPLDDLLRSNVPDSGDIAEISLDLLHDFRNHPFQVRDDTEMELLAASIKDSGVLVPGIVRMKEDGGYEIIAGHRRKRACEIVGLKTMPVIIKELTDDEATIIMVNSNIQRETLLFSEKAFAYKMRNDALKRKAGRPEKNTDRVGPDLLTTEKIALEAGESRNQIKRYIRLTELDPELLEMTDEKKIPFNTSVELSYLKFDEQQLLLLYMKKHEFVPSMNQAQMMKQISKESELTYQQIDEICSVKKQATLKIQLPSKTLRKYFPKNYSIEQMEEVLYRLLEKWSSEQR